MKRDRRSFFSKHQTIINFWLDALLMVTFLAVVWVSVIVRFVFPSAAAAAGYSLWGMPLVRWMDLQFGLIAFFFLEIVIHVMLHWTWVCGVIGGRLFRKKDGEKRTFDEGQRTILGVGLLIILLNVMGVGIAVAVLSIQSPV